MRDTNRSDGSVAPGLWQYPPVSIKAAWVMGLIGTIVVLSIAGAGFWGWVGGLLFGPLVAVVAFGMVGALGERPNG